MLMVSPESRNDGVNCVAVNCAVVLAMGQLLCQVGGARDKGGHVEVYDKDYQIGLSLDDTEV